MITGAYCALDHHARLIALAEIDLGVPLNGFDEARVQYYATRMRENRALEPVIVTQRADSSPRGARRSPQMRGRNTLRFRRSASDDHFTMSDAAEATFTFCAWRRAAERG
jgi:hypothetical protein